ncbi:hypothetical protein [Streptomyces sp. NPDC051636]|uniref:hypothetical protein n=1 Tax=Streptomyces sp. NPDC051636 TaxID=3365663 RepID=UPI0037A7BB99
MSGLRGGRSHTASPSTPHRRTRQPDLGRSRRRGRTHDVTAARHDHITAHLRQAGLGAIDDLGLLGLDNDLDNPVVITGYRAPQARLTTAQKEANKLVARECAANEHGFADLKNPRVLTKLRLKARHATALLRALLDLTRAEVSR